MLRVEEILLAKHKAVDKEETVVNATPTPVNMEVVVGIDTIENKGVTRPLRCITSIEYWAIRLNLIAQHTFPVLVRVAIAHYDMRSGAIPEVLVQSSHIGECSSIGCSIFCLEGVTKVCHQHRNSRCLCIVILTLDICLNHTIPIIDVVKVARSHIETILRGIGLGSTLCTLGPTVVAHDNRHCRLRAASKTVRIAIYGTLIIIWFNLTPTRSVKHHGFYWFVALAPLLGCSPVRHNIVLTRIAYRSIHIAQPTLKVGRQHLR